VHPIDTFAEFGELLVEMARHFEADVDAIQQGLADAFLLARTALGAQEHRRRGSPK
jgi:hypothetical protein